MIQFFTPRNSGIILLLVFGVVFIFHLLILTGLISTQEIWGGQVPPDQLVYFELSALILLIVFSWIIAVKSGVLNWKTPVLVLKFGPWVVFTYFIINTAGNLIGSTQEKWFALITFFLSILAFRIAAYK